MWRPAALLLTRKERARHDRCCCCTVLLLLLLASRRPATPAPHTAIMQTEHNKPSWTARKRRAAPGQQPATDTICVRAQARVMMLAPPEQDRVSCSHSLASPSPPRPYTMPPKDAQDAVLSPHRRRAAPPPVIGPDEGREKRGGGRVSASSSKDVSEHVSCAPPDAALACPLLIQASACCFPAPRACLQAHQEVLAAVLAAERAAGRQRDLGDLLPQQHRKDDADRRGARDEHRGHQVLHGGGER